ncbi:MAG: tRNA preQ1(34) S-adenosylmethionine ribosyltransferase-isomerase QueA [Pseudomonadota bacterium]
MQTRDFYYTLPEELIAQHPTKDRDGSRLLYLAANGQISDKAFIDLTEYFKPNDLLVFNNTRVIPARIYGTKTTGGKVEIMLERILPDDTVIAQLKVSKTPKPGTFINIEDNPEFKVLEKQDDMFLLKYIGNCAFTDFIEKHGHIPLPPYITRGDEKHDVERYQTVYSKVPGAVAAPTAGLHFTNSIIKELEAKNVKKTFLTLHVGAGTFQPVRTTDLTQHKMHNEFMVLDQASVDLINQTKAKGGRIIAVGTTVVRSLETAAKSGDLIPYTGDTDIFIYPGFNFNVVDMLLTNFHLPESTLLMLVSAFAGKENIMHAYQHAVKQRYRFFSYGDAMLLEKNT